LFVIHVNDNDLFKIDAHCVIEHNTLLVMLVVLIEESFKLLMSHKGWLKNVQVVVDDEKKYVQNVFEIELFIVMCVNEIK